MFIIIILKNKIIIFWSLYKKIKKLKKKDK